MNTKERYPGETFAKAHGYTLHSSSEYKNKPVRANYHKGCICLSIWENRYKTGTYEARISFEAKLLTISTGDFSFPHPRFAMFEGMILDAVQLLAPMMREERKVI